MSGFLPWQQTQWARLRTALQADQLPHGLLLSGPEGLGKRAFAEGLAQAALCQQPGADGACGACQTCRLYAAGTHPDLVRVAPEEDSTQIKVDQVRALIEFMGLSRHYAGHKVALIAPAEAMTINAANSLLKTLEEPTPRSLLILVAAEPARLPATVRSRCQQVKFATPARPEALAWLTGQGVGDEAERLLALAHGAPLKALDLAASDALERRQACFQGLMDLLGGRIGIVNAGERWGSKDALPEVIEWQIDWLQDAIRLRSLGAQAPIDNPDLAAGLRRIAEALDLGAMFGLRDRLIETRRLLGASLNPQLLLEDALLAWLDARGRRRADA